MILTTFCYFQDISTFLDVVPKIRLSVRKIKREHKYYKIPYENTTSMQTYLKNKNHKY